MIGRGVFENPYCFTEHVATKAELMELLNYHLDLFDEMDAKLRMKRAQALGEGLDVPVRGLAFEPLKHYFKIYVHGFDGAAELRAKMMECRDTREVRKVLAQAGEI